MDIVLSKSNWFIIKYVCQVLGWLINGIYVLLEKIGIPNIGIAMILYTVVIYLFLTPIQIKQQKFSKMMNVMQPDLQRIQKKYANKKDQASQMKMQEENMAVYEKYGVSPTGTCGPLLIQMPILLALYQVIYHIPGYVGSVRNIFAGLVENITNISGYSEILTQFVSDNRVTMYTRLGETVTTNNIYDILYVLKPSQWELLSNIKEFSGFTDLIQKTAVESTKINTFLGFNITQSPMDLITEGMASHSYLIVFGAVMIPVLAWFTQWLNYKLMPQTETTNNNQKGGMEASMKTMNTVMPIFSAFMCLSFSVGIGIYWIAGAVIRAIQMVIINRHMETIDVDELIRKNQEKIAKKREKAGLPPQKITQQAKQNVRKIEVEEPVNNEPSIEEKAAARKASTEYYQSNKEYRPGSIASKANMVRQFDEKNSKKKK